MVSLGQQITNEQIAEMIREANIDGDGTINFIGFLGTICSKVSEFVKVLQYNETIKGRTKQTIFI